MLRQGKYVRASLCQFTVMPWKTIQCIIASSSVILSITQIRTTDLKKRYSRDCLRLSGERDSGVLFWQCELKHIRREILQFGHYQIKSRNHHPAEADKNGLVWMQRKEVMLKSKKTLARHPTLCFYTNMTVFAYKCWFCCNWSSCVWSIVPWSISLMPCH